MTPEFSISIVSHGHGSCVAKLLADLAHLRGDHFELIITLNIPEKLDVDFAALAMPVKLIRNETPKGFAANHNNAFKASAGRYFVILNPDIRLAGDPFVVFRRSLARAPDFILAPMVLNSSGTVEDSARKFPTPFSLGGRVLNRMFGRGVHRESIKEEGGLLLPDWVAGMFLVVPCALYARLGGLDERYHMYFEDVDFCLRARLSGIPIGVHKDATVIHDAQRDSHRNWVYMFWHLRSSLRFFMSSSYWRFLFRRFSSGRSAL